MRDVEAALRDAAADERGREGGGGGRTCSTETHFVICACVHVGCEGERGARGMNVEARERRSQRRGRSG
jgi:hypothetical protein